MPVVPRLEDPQLDGVELAVLKARLEMIVRAMTNTLQRTGRSGVLNTGRDFSCCIVTADNELLVMAESIPVHVLSGPDLQCRSMKDFHPILQRGDAFLHNSPYLGNTHPADWSILIPVVDDEGVHRFTVVAKAHQADTGNSAPTTYSPEARDVYEEGGLIFPCIKIQESYDLNPDIMRMIETRVRVPQQALGDYLALVGAARVGEERLLDLIREYGVPKLSSFVKQWFDYCERQMVDAIRALPAGTFEADTRHDAMPGAVDGIPVRVRVAIDPETARIDVDLTDNPDLLDLGINLSEACARSAALIGVFNSIRENVPSNAGSLRRVTVRIRDGSCIGGLQHPHSASASTTDLLDRVANTTMRCFASAEYGLGMAEFGMCLGAGSSVVSGFNPDTGESFVNQIFLGYTAGAANAEVDGWLTAYCIGAAGMLIHDSVEIDEMKHPIRIVSQRLIPDSEGAGEHRGAPGALVAFTPTGGAHPLEAIYHTDGTQRPPEGVQGGLSAAPSAQFLQEADGERNELPNVGRITLQPGQTLVAHSSGGGGYGPPWKRAVERVVRDVREGYITGSRAKEVYGVQISDSGEVDDLATQGLRERLSRKAQEIS